VFGTPEIGSDGLTEKEALERFPKINVYKTNLRPLKATAINESNRYDQIAIGTDIQF
jgi:glutathione reductase (NADPH)